MNFTPVDFDPFAEVDYFIATSESQREILSSIKFGNDAANCAYNESVSLKLTGNLNKAAIEKAANAVYARHSVLRATFTDDGMQMRIAHNATIEVPFIDLTMVPADEQEAHLNEIIKEDVSAPFDLSNGPLFDVKVVLINPTLNYVVITAHHIICDGWSTGIILQDLSRFYNEFAFNKIVEAVESFQFESYVQGELEFEKSNEYAATEAYWLNLYKDYSQVFEIPIDKPRPVLRTYGAKRIDKEMDEAVVAKFKKAGAKNGCSFINTLIAAVEVFIYRITQQSDIIVGLPAAGQAATEMYSLVGHCVNLLPLKTSVDGKLKFNEYLKNRKKTLFDAFENQRYTFGTLIKKLNVPRDPSRIPLVPFAFNADLGLADGVAFEGLEMEVLSNPRISENFEIFLNATGQAGKLTLECTYNTDLFDDELMQMRINEFAHLINSIALNEEEIIDNLDLIPNSELQLFENWNSTFTKSVANSCLHKLFEHQVKLNPSATAISFNQSTLTYSKLNELADRVASLLKAKGLAIGGLVGLSVNRSSDMVVAMLGILKAGGTYLPIDPEFPAERIHYMIENSAVQFIITENKINTKLEFKCKHILLTDNWNKLLSEQTVIESATYDDAQLAYVLYTSGSTGKPKGVMISHNSLVNLLNAFKEITTYKASDKLLAVTTISFDIAQLEMFLPLVSGGTLIIASKETAIDPRSIIKMIGDNAVTFMQATPATWRMIVDAGWQGNTNLSVLCGGEALPVDLAYQLSKGNKNVWNVYGPTETTIWSSYHKLPADFADKTPSVGFIEIGKPIANTTFYVLDKNLKRLPVGIEGDIYIGGVGLAKGYLNRPDLTEERFLLNPIDSARSQYIYKTGDLGKFNKDGNIEYTGRSDFQVKVRGYRIELGEIETAVAQVEGVSAVAVTTAADATGENHLLAYVTEDVVESELFQNQLSHIDNWKEKWNLIYDSGIKAISSEHVKDRKLDTAIAQQLSGNSAIDEQVSEWLQQTIDRIINVRPQHVLEIGCGAGQLVMAIAPKCDFYHATDYSEIALDELRQRLDHVDDDLKSRIKLELRMADDFSGIKPESFDTVIINSVIQYFPDVKYLEKVIEQSLKVLKPGGCLFIGDVQSYTLLNMHHTCGQLKQADSNQSLGSLKRVIRNRVSNELELAVDIDYFESLKQVFPQITFSQYKLRRGKTYNETTKYHYDTFLFKNVKFDAPADDKWIDWNTEFKTLQQLENTIEENKPESILISNVPNQRLIKDKVAAEIVSKSNDDVNCSVIIEQLDELPESFDPEEFWEIGMEAGYTVELFWTSKITAPAFDVALIKNELYDKNTRATPKYFEKLLDIDKRFEAANQPFKADKNVVLINKIKLHLESKLPHYMLPSAYMVLGAMPLTANGKIDRKALPDIEHDSKQFTADYQEPITETEKLIATIWEKLLNVKGIGLSDNFFELGGHSIIAVRMMIEIEHLKNIRLPLAVLFTNPTIGQLALLVDNEASSEMWQSVAPIRTSGNKKPFFFAHGVSGNVFKYHALGKLLNEDVPSYGLQARGLNGIDQPYNDLEEMAEYHVKEILKIQPEGPYFLGGGSFGGTLSYEIAYQLRQLGKEIGMLALFDVEAATKSQVLDGAEKQFVELKLKSQRVVSRLKMLANQSMDDKLSYLKNKINNKNPNQAVRKKEIDDLLNKELIAEKYGTVSADYFNNIEECCYKALKNYNVKFLDCDVILYRAKNGFYSPIEYSEDLGWSYYVTGKVTVEFVSGNHNTIFENPHVPHLAAALSKHIDQYYEKQLIS